MPKSPEDIKAYKQAYYYNVLKGPRSVVVECEVCGRRIKRCSLTYHKRSMFHKAALPPMDTDKGVAEDLSL